jgi:hypothetical protein
MNDFIILLLFITAFACILLLARLQGGLLKRIERLEEAVKHA